MDLTFANVKPVRLSLTTIAYRYLLAIPLALFALASFAVKYIQDDMGDIAHLQQYGVIGAA